MMRRSLASNNHYDRALRKASQPNADFPSVRLLLEAAHEKGDARATYALATWYLHGRCFRRNLQKAVVMLRSAAARNNGDALYDLAVCYEIGTGVRKSVRKAAELYLRAALQGEKQSIYEIGRCYHHGIGVEKDRIIAKVWLDRAAALGVT